MSADEFFLYAAYFVGGILVLYLGARVVTAAYFTSKRQHETLKGR